MLECTNQRIAEQEPTDKTGACPLYFTSRHLSFDIPRATAFTPDTEVSDGGAPFGEAPACLFCIGFHYLKLLFQKFVGATKHLEGPLPCH